MTYKEKLAQSQQEAHNKVVAMRIEQEMDRLRGKLADFPTVSKRWIWELIQNARDAHNNGKVKIKIFYKVVDKPKVTFQHSGKPFTTENIRYLIEQISTKDREKDEEGKRKTTGNFGTGFLTTHFLSKIVRIEGVAKEDDLDYKKFILELDRSGDTQEEILNSIEKSKKSVENLDEKPGNVSKTV